MNARRWRIVCGALLLGVAGCSGLQPVGEGRVLQEDRIDGSLVATLPAGGPVPRTGDTVRLFRTELRGNPRQAQRAWVQIAAGVIVSMEDGRMRIRVVKGRASPGDRVLCCESPSAASEKGASERREVSRARAAQTGRTTTGGVAPALRDSLYR